MAEQKDPRARRDAGLPGSKELADSRRHLDEAKAAAREVARTNPAEGQEEQPARETGYSPS
ncbi:hypothetical protein FNH05_30980 [Amycolatopsis rhizosphaerae]|uniref:Uncharacterized protein n=1 Tax=Amycolatopsis rhizosphaerae TaxID=2053003 RepID=A0A558ASD8_9PSEU|nr:hypothetical protein [Amycolatopsis rhizosphaerae]TVT27180.1 hypothetical protein FNH05_30980 [Amycolatopsis rhizosphaerae]